MLFNDRIYILQPLVFIFPADGTFWMSNPLCTLDLAPWATPIDIEAAQLFTAFALNSSQASDEQVARLYAPLSVRINIVHLLVLCPSACLPDLSPVGIYYILIAFRNSRLELVLSLDALR